MITYNHEHFIAQAIRSVLMQEIDFPIELVIGEDCSTDGTRNIVKELAEKYPKEIKTLLSDKNLGGRDNFRQVIAACSGEYIAILEGDDYWTSSHKLQRQVDFLERFPGVCDMFP